MAKVNICSGTGGVLAADEQNVIIETRNEDDTTVLLDTEFVGSSSIVINVCPVRIIDFAGVEELVVPSDGNLGGSVFPFMGEEATSVGGEIVALVVPITELPRVDR